MTQTPDWNETARELLNDAYGMPMCASNKSPYDGEKCEYCDVLINRVAAALAAAYQQGMEDERARAVDFLKYVVRPAGIAPEAGNGK